MIENVYGGFELSWRDLDEPAPQPGREFTEDRKEQLYRTYVYWALDANWAIRGGVEYDVFDSKKPTRYLLTQVQSLSFPLDVRYFSPLGFFGGIGASFVRQDVNRQEGAPLAEGENSFVVVDASLGYRLPQRRGLVSLEARNLLNEGFKFQDDNYRVAQDQPNLGPLIPGRAILGRLTLNF